MNIGEFKMINGRLMGWIATRTIDLPRLYLRKVESSNDRAPVYEIDALNVGNRVVQIGALWQAVARNTTGEVFLQGSIDDPSLPEPLPIALFGNLEEGFRVAWRRPQRRDDFFAPSRGSRGEDAGMGDGTGGTGGMGLGGGGGFGDSTAGADGGLMGAGGDGPLGDDHIPF